MVLKRILLLRLHLSLFDAYIHSYGWALRTVKTLKDMKGNKATILVTAVVNTTQSTHFQALLILCTLYKLL